MNTNTNSFVQHLLRYVDCKETNSPFVELRSWGSGMLERNIFINTRYIASFYTGFGTSHDIFDKSKSKEIPKSDYNDDIKNLLSLYNHYSRVYNSNKPLYLMVEMQSLSGLDSSGNMPFYMKGPKMFKTIMDYYHLKLNIVSSLLKIACKASKTAYKRFKLKTYTYLWVFIKVS